MFLIRSFSCRHLPIRNLAIRAAKGSAAALLLAMGLAGISGCAYSYRTPAPEPLNDKPIVEDGAMAARQWNPSVAYYENDTVMTHPTYAPLEPTVLPYEANALTETPLLIANTVYWPVGMFIDAPWIYQANKSLSMPPTYTAMPPLTTKFTALPPRPGSTAAEPPAPEVNGPGTPAVIQPPVLETPPAKIPDLPAPVTQPAVQN